MENELSFMPLLVVVTVAAIIPVLVTRFRRFRIPIVVGEIIVGIIIGRSGLGLVEHHDIVLDLLSEFGFVFLMFLSGMEIDFSNLGSSKRTVDQKTGGNPITLGGLSFLLTLSASILFGFWFVRLKMVDDPWMLALILSTTSLGVVVPVLKEHRLSTGFYGQTLLIAALIADFATMFLITVVVALLSSGLTVDILLIGFLFLAFFLMYRFGMFFFNKVAIVRRTIEELSSATAQIKVRVAFTMMLIFVGLAEIVGTEVILGAFLAGAIVSLLRRPEDDELVHQLDAIGFGFFIPIFFVMVGVDFNINALLESSRALLLVPVLLVAALVVKFLAALVFKLAFDWRSVIGAGTLLSSRLSLIIAASAIGLRLGVISESINAAIILVAIITVTFAPPLFMRIIPMPEGEGRRPTLIAGAGKIGLQVADRLKTLDETPILIDIDTNRIDDAIQRGYEAYIADLDAPSDEMIAIFNRADALICVHSNIDRNYELCKLARITFGIDNVVARVTEPAAMSRFEGLGVSTLNPALDQSNLLVMLARNPALYGLLTRSDASKKVCEATVTNPNYLNRPLHAIQWPTDLLVVAVMRDNELIVPNANTQLQVGDHLTLMGDTDCIDETRELITRST